MLSQAIKDAEERVKILDHDFWLARKLLGKGQKREINRKVGVESVRFASPEQAIKIKEMTMEEVGSNEVVEKVTLDIDSYKAKFNMLVIDGEEGLRDAESLQSQVKAAKSQVNAATKLEWERAKKAYDDSKQETDKKKKEYINIRDKRNMMLNACTDIFKGIKAKIEYFHAELRRKAEEERLAKEEEECRIKAEEYQKIENERRAAEQIKEAEEKAAALYAKNEEDKEKAKQQPPIDVTAKEKVEKITEDCDSTFNPPSPEPTTPTNTNNENKIVNAQCDHGKYPDETCKVCGAEPCQEHILHNGGPDGCFCAECGIELCEHGYSSKEKCDECDICDAINAQPPEKEEEAKTESITKEIDVDIKALAFAIYQRMAPEILLLPNMEEIKRILTDGGTVPGCRFKES
jgi:hypothetical protein